MTFSPSWSLTSSGPKLAALANGGTFVEAGSASHWHTNSGVALWSTVPGISFQPRIDANADTLASLRLEQSSPTSPRTPTLRRFTPASGVPSWTYQFPFPVQNTSSGLHVSRDGQRIAAWVFTFQAKPALNPAPANGQVVDVAIFVGSNPLPTRYLSVYLSGQPTCSALSADGTRLLIVSAIKYVLIDTVSGQLLVDGFNTVQTGQFCGINENGSTYAIARLSGAVDVWRGTAQSQISNGSAACIGIKLGANTVTGWNDGKLLVDGSQIETPAPMVDMDVSPDGSTIACVAGGVTILERTGSGWAISLGQHIVGATDVDVSNDQVSAVTSSGQIQVFKRGAASGPTSYSVNIPAAQAVTGSEHDALAVPAGSGPAKRVRVL